MTHRWKRFFRVTVLDPGTNYETTPTVTVDNPSAPRLPAVGTASIDSSAGKVSGVVVDSGGTYYDAAPVVTIAAPSGEGTTATGTATISAGEVTGVSITDSGSGYTSAPAVTIASSTGEPSNFKAQVSVTMGTGDAAGTIASVNVTDSGNFYDSDNPPSVTISAPVAEKNYTVGEEVTLDAQSDGTIVSGEVADWDPTTSTLGVMHVSNNKGTFTEPGTGGFITGTDSKAKAKVTKVVVPDTVENQADEFETTATDFLDFSESNPFGDPPQIPVVSTTPTSIIVKGNISDPSFAYPRTYKITANGTSYTFEADATSGGNFYEGIRGLEIDGLEIGIHTTSGINQPNGTLATNAVMITYTAQNANDTTLTLSGDGFLHIGIEQRTYNLDTTTSVVASGDSAATRFGESAFVNPTSAEEYAQEVARSSTSMVWDSDASNFGMSNIQFVKNYNIPSPDADGIGVQPSGIIFGDNGRRIYYGNVGTSTNSAKIYSRRMTTAYDVSTITTETETIANLNNDLGKSLVSTSDPTVFDRGERVTAFTFNPDGTKMWAVENENDAIAQYNLSTAWDISTATFDKGAISRSVGGYQANTGFTQRTGWPGGNNYTMDWYDSGRKLALTKLGYKGQINVASFSSPYDIGSYASDTDYYNGIPLTPANSYGNAPLIPRFEYKLAFQQGSQFNHDGTRRYFLHKTFSDSDYDSSSSGVGNGLNGWRTSLIRTDLSSPYDLASMTFHSQIELTNRGNAGAPTEMTHSGAFAFHPDGTKIIVAVDNMQNAPTESPWTGSAPTFIEFSGVADSANMAVITRPDLSVKPFVAADSDDAWAEPYLTNSSLTAYRDLIDASSPHYFTLASGGQALNDSALTHSGSSRFRVSTNDGIITGGTHPTTLFGGDTSVNFNNEIVGDASWTSSMSSVYWEMNLGHAVAITDKFILAGIPSFSYGRQGGMVLWKNELGKTPTQNFIAQTAMNHNIFLNTGTTGFGDDWTPARSGSGEHFGVVVAASGSWIGGSAPYWDADSDEGSSNFKNYGAVWVKDLTGVDSAGVFPGWNDSAGNGTGRGYVLRTPDPWQQDAFFGESLILDSDFNRILVGEPGKNYSVNSVNYTNLGRVHVYALGTGAYERSIDHPFPERGGREFGRRTAMSGDYIAVGDQDYTDSNSSTSNDGAVHIFKATDGSYLRTIKPDTPSVNDTKFGIDLAMEGNKISVLTDDGDFYMFNVDGTKKAGPFRDPRGTVSTDEGNRTPKFMGVKMSGNIAAIITNDGSTNEVYPNMGDDSDGNKVKRIWYHDTNNLNEGITTAVSHRVRASTNTHINWGNTNRGGPGSLFSTSSPTNDFYQYGFDIHGYQTIVGAPYQSDANATTTDKKGVGRLYLYGDSTGSDYVLGSEAWQTSDSRSPLTSTAYTVSVGTGPLFGQAGTEGNVFYLEESA